MNDLDLLLPAELPPGFVYPPRFLRIVQLGLHDLEPWFLVEGERLRAMRQGLLHRYPSRNLVPFACRQDNDDIACWESPDQDTVHVIHDWATPGWEEREMLPTFYHWLRKAIEDLIDFDV